VLIIPLGINGYMPSFGRQTATILVIDNGHAAILDAGTGLARLREPRIKSLVDRCDTVSIILSHYHLDHVIGLTYLPDVLPDREVTIFAPAPPLTDYGPDEALSHLFHQSLFSLDLPDFRFLRESYHSENARRPMGRMRSESSVKRTTVVRWPFVWAVSFT